MGAKTWQETVINDNELQLAAKGFVIKGGKPEPEWKFIANKQAKITGDIAFKAGIKEVIEWMKTNLKEEYDEFSIWSIWQAKLKEWGIEDG